MGDFSGKTVIVTGGAKGIGRLLWLKAFESVTIRSSYNENGKSYIREFGFSLPDGVTNPTTREVTQSEPTGTVIKLGGWLQEYAMKGNEIFYITNYKELKKAYKDIK